MIFDDIYLNISVIFNLIAAGLLTISIMNEAEIRYERRPASHYRARPKDMKTNATRFVHPPPENIYDAVLPDRRSSRDRTTSFHNKMVHRVQQPSGDQTISTVELSCEERQQFAPGTTPPTTPDVVSSDEKTGKTIPKTEIRTFDKSIARLSSATKPARKLPGKMIRRFTSSGAPKPQNLG